MLSPLKESEALAQNPDNICPLEIISRQILVDIKFRGFDDKVHDGQMVVDRALANDVKMLFSAILRQDFPISSIIPISHPSFAWDDEKSMLADNSSAFNYRTIAGTDRLSYHAYGKALDINPKLNPYLRPGIVQPPGAVYEPGKPGVIVEGDFITKLMDELGWEWGGRWTEPIDYQHFQKP